MPTAGRGKGKIALFLQNRASPLAQLTHTYKIWKCLMYPLKKKLEKSILKEISPGCSLEGLILKLKL